ncbi:hypothetical protein LCGC14_1484950 [marine sediment metagenome]|uniref:Uncharacterized protein n=1 Tax=marine sediment metagenome TaxID=412755 RepID=A0A0F9LNX7_9ZZZZ
MTQTWKIRGRATRITTENGTTRVRYHDTDVVVFDDETIMLNTGGWRTVTTKTRMNQTANQYDLGFSVYQKNFEWFVQTAAGTWLMDGRTFSINRRTQRSTLCLAAERGRPTRRRRSAWDWDNSGVILDTPKL